MAIEEMFRALEEQAEQECEQIRLEAKAQADMIIREAEDRAENMRARRLAEAESHAKSKAAHIVNAARLANKKDVASLKGRVVQGVYDSAKEKLGTVRSKPDYERLFKSLVEEAVACSDGECELLVGNEDAALAQDVVKTLGRNGMVISPTLNTSGGAIAAESEGRIMHKNTLEDRLSKAWNGAQAQVARILFS